MKARGFCFTWNNYDEKTIEYVDSICKEAVYAIYGKEVAPTTGTKHLQGYIYFRNPRSLKAVIKLLKGSHVAIAKGSSPANAGYCKKDNDWKEYGSPPQQGARGDLLALKDSIVNGKRVDEIVIENPGAFHQYGRTLDRIETVSLRKKFRTEMTKGLWYYGPTGTGKSHEAFKNYHPDNCYIYNTETKWWDGYRQQETVIINDFRGELPYNYLLQLVDKWPMNVPIRGKEDVPFTSKTVIITSSLGPEEVYVNRNRSDGIEQLHRRFEVKKMEQKWSEGNNVTSEPL